MAELLILEMLLAAVILRVRSGYGKSGKSMEFVFSISRPGKSMEFVKSFGNFKKGLELFAFYLREKF